MCVNFYACEEHVDFVIEDFINLYGVPPNLDLYKDIEENRCNYCNELAKYILAFIEN